MDADFKKSYHIQCEANFKMIYDIENFLDELETFLKDNLNTKIQSVNTEKNDSLTLSTIDSSAYFFQTMNDTVSNFDPFVYYGLQEIESIGMGPATMKKFIVVVAIILEDSAEDIKIGKRLLRYSKALSELVEAHYADITSHSLKVKIQNLTPISFKLIDTSENFRAVGIELDVNIF